MSASPAVLQLIPHRPPFLFVDEIVSCSADSLVARRTFRADEDFYQGHYPNAPITPGVLLCEAVFQAGALYLARILSGPRSREGLPLLVKISAVRFRHPVYPGETILIEVTKKAEMGGFYLMSGSVKSGDKRVLNVDFSVAWKAPEAKTPSGAATRPAENHHA
ncbi:MAG: beta-hydroxyacyl-ACP dehydratase [Opitutaceae bacterium]|nr:beta-hydroxyacyl-ACP dehydratase [Opitutaceae bacterium]